jgi:signal transduction histidine kinase
MLNVSRIESGRLSLEMKSIQIMEVIERQVAEMVPRAKQLGLSLTLTKPSAQVPLVNADHERIEQVIINLVGNSLKFTPSGGSINVLVEPMEKELLVKVTDTGRGMGKEDLAKLFQKFGTMGGNYLHKQEAQGTGLGLYLSKKLIEMHGGKMWAESEGEGKGATFNFTLPYPNH